MENNIKRTSKKLVALAIGLSVLLLIVPLVIALIGIFIIGNGVYTKFDYGVDGDVVLNNRVKIENVSSELDENNDRYVVTGTLSNISNGKIETIVVEYTFYDINDNLLGKATTYLDKLGKDKTWIFKVNYDEIDSNSVAKYKLSRVEFY